MRDGLRNCHRNDYRERLRDVRPKEKRILWMTKIEYFDLWFSSVPGEYEDFGQNRNIQTVYQVSGDIEVPLCIWSAPPNRTASETWPGAMFR